jgi:hypothetical protein
MNRHHRQHSTSAPPAEAFGQTSLALAPPWQFTDEAFGRALQMLLVLKESLLIQAQPSGPHACTQACLTSEPKQVPQALAVDSISDFPSLDWMPQTPTTVSL